jgi:hypothetical protein
MTSSLRLLLEDFLGLMKEEGELDLFLPLLLSAMGHAVIHRAQKGTRQYGVDISTVGVDVDGREKLFLWLVKRGEIGRHEWDSGPQTVRQSINDVGDIYIRTHIAPERANLPRKLVVLTNGDFNAAIALSMAQFLETWSSATGVESESVNGSKLASWVEKYLLDEYVLPLSERTLLRRMLANVGTPDLAVTVGRSLVDAMLVSATAPAATVGSARKALLGGLRGIRTAVSVLYRWAQEEQNLIAPYRLAEYAVLAVWRHFHLQVQRTERDVSTEFSELLFLLAEIGNAYHRKLEPFYMTQNGFAHQAVDSLVLAEIVFHEVGRLGFQGLFWALMAVRNNDEAASSVVDLYVTRLATLLESHSCCASPALDEQSIDVHCGLLLLLAANRREEAAGWLRELCGRMKHIVHRKKYWPLRAAFENALEVRHSDDEPPEDYLKASTLVPLLLVWSAALGRDDLYKLLREDVLPQMNGITPNFWSSDTGFDAIVSDAKALSEHGVGEAVLVAEENPADFLRRMRNPLAEVQAIEQSSWYQTRLAYIPLLAALHWRLQVPRQMLVEQTIAFCTPTPTVSSTQ